MRFDGCFLWVAVPLDRDAAGETPFRRLAVRPDIPRVLIEDVRVDLFQVVVVLELLFDLAEEGLVPDAPAGGLCGDGARV